MPIAIIINLLTVVIYHTRGDHNLFSIVVHEAVFYVKVERDNHLDLGKSFTII